MLAKLTAALIVLMALVVACQPPPSSSDTQRQRQEVMVNEGVQQVGMPAIKNFRELKMAKDIYELRDQTGLITYTYLWSEIQAKMVFLCDSIGYPIPYATQFSAPDSMQRYVVPATINTSFSSGVALLPQAEPNGLFIPDSADGTWVMCLDGNGKDSRPVYVEPKVITLQFKVP